MANQRRMRPTHQVRQVMGRPHAAVPIKKPRPLVRGGVFKKVSTAPLAEARGIFAKD